MKATKKDFEYFEQRVKYWQDYLGIKEWAIYCKKANLNSSYAQTAWSLNSGTATIQLASEWDDFREINEKELDTVALHEVMHVLLAPLVAEAEDRFTSQNSIEVAEHRIIRQIEHLVRGKENC